MGTSAMRQIRRLLFGVLIVSLVFWEWLVLSILTFAITDHLPLESDFVAEIVLAISAPLLIASAIYWNTRTRRTPRNLQNQKE
jgi:hypothetical protein